MRKIAFCIFLLVINFSCRNEDRKILNGFENLKLGMTIPEVEKLINRKIDIKPADKTYKIADQYVGDFAEIDSLQINSKIKLSSVYLEFKNQKLIYITTNYNSELFKLLKNDYGIEQHMSDGTDIFKTNSNNSFACISNNRRITIANTKEKFNH